MGVCDVSGEVTAPKYDPKEHRESVITALSEARDHDRVVALLGAARIDHPSDLFRIDDSFAVLVVFDNPYDRDAFAALIYETSPIEGEA